jgi:hypothetical protein
MPTPYRVGIFFLPKLSLKVWRTGFPRYGIGRAAADA